MMRIAAILIACSAIALADDSATLPELLPADLSIADAIDRYISQTHSRDGIVPAERAADTTIHRRMTLDLVGRIPTVSEQQWLQTIDPETRVSALAERLMEQPGFSLHLRNEMDKLLLPRQPNDGKFREYLLWAIQENRSWETMFRDMLLPQPSEGPQSGAIRFIETRIGQVDDLTNDTAVLFFGVNISCAKCHDHPLVEDWKQDHYYGMQSFFTRTYKTKKNTLAEKFYDQVKFKTTAGEDKTAAFMFLTGRVLEDRTPKFNEDERKSADEKIRNAQKDDKAEIPVPDFSPRRELVEAALTDEEQLFFARNIVNRVWARLIGTGIVDPPDQMHSANPPSHPELLLWLARDLKTNNYDLKRLINGIVQSAAYLRSSTWTQEGDAPHAQAFALGRIQPLSPRQLAASLLVAGRSPDYWVAVGDPEEWARQREQLEKNAEGWSREFEVPGDSFQIAVDEALFFSNSSRVEDDILRTGNDRLIGHLTKTEDIEQITTTLTKVVFCREPTQQEREVFRSWLSRENGRVEVLQQLTWAMLAGPEFRFNH